MDLLFNLRIVLWLVLAWLAQRHSLISKYRLFFSYAAFVSLLDLLMPLFANWTGRDSYTYLYTYLILKALVFLFEATILLNIWWLFSPPCLKRDWHLIAVPLCLFLTAFTDWRLPYLFIRMISSGDMTVAYIGAVTLYRAIRIRDIELGWNLKMILFGLTVPSVFQDILRATYQSGSFKIPTATIDLWLRAADIVFWIVIVVGMSEYSPPRRADGTIMLRRRKALPTLEPEAAMEKNMRGVQ